MDEKPIYRHEDKFLINPMQYARLRAMVSAVMRVDAYAQNGRGYPIRSLYFDTLSNRDYHEKADGVDERQKLRLRVYGASASVAKLEIKHRKEGGIFKESVTLAREEAEELLKPGADPAFLLAHASEAARNAYALFKTRGYAPAAVIDYRREAYTLPFYQIRVTFDSDIRAGREARGFFDPQLHLTPVLPPDEIVLEVKYNHMFPAFLKPVTGMAEGQEMSISKYYQARLLLG